MPVLGPAVKLQYRTEMRASWAIVDGAFESADIPGPRAAQVLLRHSTRASHHEFPCALSVMAGLVACTNGAKVAVFPGPASPLMLSVINVNYPQTRKSSTHSSMHEVSKEIDGQSKDRAEGIVRDGLHAGQGALGVGPAGPPPVQVNSATLTSFANAAFFQRCAGDWGQVRNGAELGCPGRVHFGTLINVDEAYKMLRMIGLVSAGGAASKGGDALDVTDAASEFNRLLQTGTASYTTKNAGAYGEAAAPTISMGVLGNGRPSVIIPMGRGDIGSNHVAAKERLLFVAGRPVEPRAPVPARLQVRAGEVFKPWVWPKLLMCMSGPLCLLADVAAPAGARAKLQRARRRPDCGNESDDEGDADDAFDPDASGYMIELVDGTSSRLRFRKRHGERGEVAWVADYRVANRAVPIPEDMTMKRRAERVLEYFSAPHAVIPWTEDALLAHKGLCVCFNAECAVRRDDGDVEEAARLGAAPWHLAVLSSALLVLEIAVGEHDGTADFRSRCLRVQEAHVVRGFDLIRLCHDVRKAWQAETPGDADAAAALASQALENASRSQLAAMPPNGLPGFDEWQATQTTPQVPPVPEPEGGEGAPGGTGAGTFPADVDPPVHPAGAPRGGAPAAAPAQPLMLLKPGDPEVPSMGVGHGEGGAQVQRPDVGAVILKDREMMKKTLMRGGARVFCPDACDSISAVSAGEGAKRSRKALRRAHWEAVMRAGLEKYRVGTFVHRTDSEAPPQGDAAAAGMFHNRLMEMCQLGLATYMECASKRAEKQSARPPK
ncbi:unnamed protein product [Prorocentrum cordatum]|uniref:Uncharacterized protein n=1 Tax=Prorocentrum cordatum TaxID=2364126 RepID=A0ABN9R469_9DINO|nr:unnamed protein product [Polarella glacialis]